jgi:cobalt/nickel transport system permease protein
MHIADGFLEAPVIITTAVVSAGLVTAVAKKTPPKELASPMVGASAAFVLAAQMVNFPVASSVSGHIIGGVLVAVLLGWRVSVLVLTSVIVIQSLVFQDGGVAALGANILNLGIVGPGLGYLLFRTVRGNAAHDWTLRSSVAAFLGGWTASVVAALMAAVQLWLSGQADLKTIVLLMFGVHALIGVAEGMATVLIARFLNHHHQKCSTYSQVPGGEFS